MVERVKPAVVRIATDLAIGSGVIFRTEDESAYVVTNQHVIEDSRFVEVTVNDSTTHQGSVLGFDVVPDLAVVKICCGDFQSVPFGNAFDLERGAEVVSIGYALGLPGDATVTRGVVSAVRYNFNLRSEVIQTDASINFGNSGGPIFSLDGEVLGINTFKFINGAEGLGFAVSAATVKSAVPRLIAEASDTPSLAASIFQDNTVRLLVGFPAEDDDGDTPSAPSAGPRRFSGGNGFDDYARLIARHLGKHIPGNPEVVVENMVENMEGEGSLSVANHLYSEAEPDGLTLGMWDSNRLLVGALAEDPEALGVRFDGREFGYLGAPSDGNSVCAVMGRVEVTDAYEILAHGATYKYGATAGYGEPLGDLPRIANAFIGADYEVIADYGSPSRVRRALENGDVDMACWDWDSMQVIARSNLDAVMEDRLIPFVKVFSSDDSAIDDLPLLGDFIADPVGMALYDLWMVSYSFQRPLTAPPGVDPKVIDLLQQAFADTMADPEFIADAERVGLRLNPQTGDDVEDRVARIIGLSPATRTALQFLIAGLE